MKKIYLIVVLVFVAFTCLTVSCAKTNTDQPCGIYAPNEQLFKSGDSRCYYIDNQTGKTVYVDNSNCTCF